MDRLEAWLTLLSGQEPRGKPGPEEKYVFCSNSRIDKTAYMFQKAERRN